MKIDDLSDKRRVYVAVLKIKEKEFVNEYFDMIVSSGFFTSITLPTRISNSGATLIDNFL